MLTVAPPYNWPWTWDATSGAPSVSAAANEKAGTISLSTWTDLNNSSSASAACRRYLLQTVHDERHPKHMV
jgi:hypothetical protein